MFHFLLNGYQKFTLIIKVKQSFISSKIMENIQLKRQKQLADSLPQSQLGSRFTKLAKGFSVRVNPPAFGKLKAFSQHICDDKIIESTDQKQNTKDQKMITINNEYIKQMIALNQKLKSQNISLKQDIRRRNQQLRLTEIKALSFQEEIKTLNVMARNKQLKIKNLIQFVYQLIIILKEKSVKICSLQHKIYDQSQMTPVQLKKRKISKNLDDIKDIISRQFKQPIRSIGKSLKSVNKRISTSKPNKSSFGSLNIIEKLQEPSQQNDKLDEAIKIFDKDVKQIKVLQTLMKQLVVLFNQSTEYTHKNNITELKIPKKRIAKLDQGIKKLGPLVEAIRDHDKQQKIQNFLIHSNQYTFMVEPTYQKQKIFLALKQIFQHQIYILQNEKMNFLEVKNKRLLKLLYQCNGCSRYQQMIKEIFGIIREGFKQMRLKIIPDLKNKDDFFILL